jgi:hypothetical protein
LHHSFGEVNGRKGAWGHAIGGMGAITQVVAKAATVHGVDMGGPKAPLSPQEGVTAMRRLIDTFGPNQSGKLHNYDGREYPW